MTLLLAFLAFTFFGLALCGVVAARCPLVRIILRLFSAQAERHQQARFVR